MSELDLGLKVGTRRLLWAMGYSTRLNVVLRGDRRTTSGRGSGKTSRASAPETFTDLDVLGVFVAPGVDLRVTIADCKTGGRDKPTARMFWARGVADLFGADNVMLVRDREVNDATHQLANRLGITVLPPVALEAMQQLHGAAPVPADDVLSVLFDRSTVARIASATSKVDRKLSSLLEYRDFDYWVYDEYRNPVQLVAHLSECASTLDHRNPVHLGLFLDLAWQYVLSLAKVVAHVRAGFINDLDRGLQEYLFGGATNLREKADVASLLRSVAPEGTQNLDHLPHYYSQLRELVMRLLRRSGEIQEALRYAELTSALMTDNRKISLPSALGEDFDAVAAKLLADVCGFLVAAAGLDAQFRIQARAWLLAERVTDAESSNSARPVAEAEEPPIEMAAPSDGQCATADPG